MDKPKQLVSLDSPNIMTDHEEKKSLLLEEAYTKIKKLGFRCSLTSSKKYLPIDAIAVYYGKTEYILILDDSPTFILRQIYDKKKNFKECEYDSAGYMTLSDVDILTFIDQELEKNIEEFDEMFASSEIDEDEDESEDEYQDESDELIAEMDEMQEQILYDSDDSDDSEDVE